MAVDKTRSSFVAKLVKDPAAPPETVLMTGFLGDSSEKGHTRLYLDLQLSSWYDIPNEAVLHSEDVSQAEQPLRADAVWVDRVTRPEHAHLQARSIREIADEEGRAPADVLLDLALAEDLQTGFWTALTGGDLDATGAILRSPYVLVGLSDAGAHVEFDAAFGYGTTLLGQIRIS